MSTSMVKVKGSKRRRTTPKLRNGMTGKEIACVIKRSHFRWCEGALQDDLNEPAYCAIGILGRIGGLPPAAYEAGAVVEGILHRIAGANDKADSKAGAVENICTDLGEQRFDVLTWLDAQFDRWQQHKEDRRNGNA